MKVKFLIAALFFSLVAAAQPSNYIKFNTRGRWIAGMFDSTLHVPRFNGSPSLRTGGSSMDGAIAIDTTNGIFYFYQGGSWKRANLDTSAYAVTSVYRKTASDSVFYVKGGVHTFAFKDSTGGGTPTLQQVLTAGSTLTTNNTIDADDNDLTIQSSSSPIGSVIYLSGDQLDLYANSGGPEPSSIRIKGDSLEFEPLLGRMSIDTLAAASNMTNKKVMTWDTVTKRWEQIAKDSVGGTGAKSITKIANSFELVNDSATITGTKVYGTDSSGNKGWQPALKTILTNPTANQILTFRDQNTLINTDNLGSEIGILSFKVGETNAPADGDSILTYSGFIGKYLSVYRAGLRQFYDTLDGVEVDTSIGEVTFHPVLTTGEKIIIEKRNYTSITILELDTTAAQSFDYTITEYSGAGVAYSLMKIDSTYTGYAINVRRSSDNTTQDIGFVNNYLDTASLLSFVGAGDGYIDTWYDQSGNGRDLEQSTTSIQPKIMSSGVIYNKNNRPSVYFGGSEYLSKSGFTINQPDTWFVVGQIDATANRGFFDGISERQIIGHNGTHIINFAGSFGSYGSSVTNFSLFYSLFNNTSSNVSVNNDAGATVSSGTNNLNGLHMGYWGGGGGMTGYISELIGYPSNQSSNKTGISTSINNRYSIY